MGSRLFGCDACQEACPHNRGVLPGDEQLPGPGAPLSRLDLASVLGWDERDWDRATRGTATRRATCGMFLRNAVIAAGNARADGSVLLALKRLARRPAFGDLARWALGRLENAD